MMGKRHPTAVKFEAPTVLGSDLHSELFRIPDITYLLPVKESIWLFKWHDRNSELGEMTQ